MSGEPSITRPHDDLRLEIDGEVAHLVLDRPERHNSQVPSMWPVLAQVARSLPRQVRVVVLRGEGASFSSGLDRNLMTEGGVPGERDLVSLGRMPAPALQEQIAAFQEGFAVWQQIPQISIAAVSGYAIGAGLQLALACDLRIVAEDARLMMRETSLGLVPDLTGTHPLVRAVGYSRALEMCLTGRPVGAAEAVRWGLASLSVPTADLDDATQDLVEAVLANPAPAVRELKKLLLAAQESTPVQQQFAERAAQSRLLALLAEG